MPLHQRMLASLLTVRGLTVAAIFVPLAILIQLSLDAGVPQRLIQGVTPAPVPPTTGPAPPSEATPMAPTIEDARPAQFSWRELADTFQGPMMKVDGTTAWTVLRVSEIDPASGRFRFSLNVGEYRQDGQGTFTPSDSRISIGDLHGLISRTGDGRLRLQSWPASRRPMWSLTGRTLTKLVEPEDR